MDVGTRIVALEGSSRPDSYAEYFEELESLGVISRNLSSRLKEMARFRNFIVHQYHQVDEDELRRIIDDDLKDIEEFVQKVKSYYNA